MGYETTPHRLSGSNQSPTGISNPGGTAQLRGRFVEHPQYLAEDWHRETNTQYPGAVYVIGHWKLIQSE